MLIGTTSVERSEYLSRQFTKRRIPHNVLNAKYHEQEASIIAEAGRLQRDHRGHQHGRPRHRHRARRQRRLPGRQAAARARPGPGRDARGLRGRPGTKCCRRSRPRSADEAKDVIAAGGLYVLGTERHESRRIDNQLRGRSGRQGDPGESRFYLSLGDELMRRFNGATLESLLTRLNLPDDVPIEAKMVTRAIKSAQTQVEQQNFEIRKNVLKYDEVMNQQRKVIYAERRRILEGENLAEQAHKMLIDVDHRLRRRRHRRGLLGGLGPRAAVDGAASSSTRSASTTTT